MALRDITGNARSALVTVGGGPTALSIEADDLTGWPTGGANGKFIVTTNTGQSNEERFLGSVRSGNIITIAQVADRGVDGTVASTISPGDTIEHTNAGFQDKEANDHINLTTHDHHTQYMKADGTRHDLTARHLLGTSIPAAVAPNTLVPDAAPTVGASTSAARADHGHGISAGTPIAVGTALAEGVSALFARSDHGHELGSGSIDTLAQFAGGVISDLSPFASSIRPPTAASAPPAGAVTGQLHSDSDAPVTLNAWDGASWRYLARVGDGEGVSYTPTIFGFAVQPTITDAWYTRINKIAVGVVQCELNQAPISIIAVQIPPAITAANRVAAGFGAARGRDTSGSDVYAGVGLVTNTVGIDRMSNIGTAGTTSWQGGIPFAWTAGDTCTFFWITLLA